MLEVINTNFAKGAGKIVKETGKKWKIKTKFKTVNPANAKLTFWNHFYHAPFRGSSDILYLSQWDFFEECFEITKKSCAIQTSSKDSLL